MPDRKIKEGFPLSRIGCVALLSLLAACAPLFKRRPPLWTPENALRPVAAPLPADDLDADSLKRAIAFSLQRLETQDPETLLTFGRQKIRLQRLKDSLTDLQARLGELGLGEPFYRYLQQNYLFFRSSARQVLFSGYYEPLLRGSLQPSPAYPYPLYRRPEDLLVVDLSQYYFFKKYPDLPRLLRGRLADNDRVIPYYSREEIDSGSKLAGKNLEIIWVDDPVDIFFLQIQGSGQVVLEDGRLLHIGYADQNGHPYRAIGQLLIQMGVLKKEEASMQSIRAFLRAHPQERERILNANPSYVFFRLQEEGPFGSFGAPLTPWRSLAADSRLFPPGALALIETEKPVFDDRQQILRWERFRRLALIQDTGGAIRGAERIDLFCGSGAAAEATAGHMRQAGTFVLLLKKE